MEHHWSDFRHDPKQVLLHYFDGYFYKANWGTLILMFRFPNGLINQAAIDPSDLNRAALVRFPGSDTYPAWRP